jgi:ParB/RepB/Spo0J family partition protein
MRAVGLVCPITVVARGDRYQVVAGHRRYLAAESLEWSEIESNVVDLSDEECRKLSLAENLDRRDLTVAQETRAIVNIYGPDANWREVAKDLGKSRSWVRNRLRLYATVSDEVLDKFDGQTLTASDILSFLQAPEGMSSQAMLDRVLAKREKGAPRAFRHPCRPRPISEDMKLVEWMLDYPERHIKAADAILWAAGKISTRQLTGMTKADLVHYRIHD